MAKGNMFLGMARGSVGDVTFYRNRNQQVARARNRRPLNPKTEAQTIQRMILATASKAYSRMKGIVDHSFQGVQYGGVSQSYFLKRAMEDLRNWVALTLPTYPESVEQNPLGVFGLATPTSAYQSGIGLLISEGSIPTVEAVTVTPEGEGAVPSFDHFGKIITDMQEEPRIDEVLLALGAQAGDQITCVGLQFSQAGRNIFSASRYVIRADATSEELAEAWDGTKDSSAFDQVKSSVGVFQIVGVSGGKVKVTAVNNQVNWVDAAAIIISRKVGDVWQRSTQRLVWLGEAVDLGGFTEDILPEWLAGTTPIDTINPRYLNQAEQTL